MSGAQLQQPALAPFPPSSRAGQHRAPFPPPPPIFPHLPRRPAAQRACTLRRAPPSVLPAPPSPGRCPCGRCQRRLGWLDSQHLRGEPSSPIFLSSPRRSTRACVALHHLLPYSTIVPPSTGRCPRLEGAFVDGPILFGSTPQLSHLPPSSLPPRGAARAHASPRTTFRHLPPSYPRLCRMPAPKFC